MSCHWNSNYWGTKIRRIVKGALKNTAYDNKSKLSSDLNRKKNIMLSLEILAGSL